jgi:Spy/CpxP family protein refolding chaperone
MKPKLLTFAVLFAAAETLMGQHHRGSRTPPTPEEMVERRIERLTTVLELTAAQQQQAKTIFTEEATSAQALHTKLSDAREALQNAVKTTGLDADIERAAAQLGPLYTQLATVQGKAQAKFLSILTTQQKEKLAAMPELGHGPGGPGRRGGPR